MNQLLNRISVAPKTQTKNHGEFCIKRYLKLCTQWPCTNEWWCYTKNYNLQNNDEMCNFWKKSL